MYVYLPRIPTRSFFLFLFFFFFFSKLTTMCFGEIASRLDFIRFSYKYFFTYPQFHPTELHIYTTFTNNHRV
ncbi:hypothetical protein EV426DRAFT_607358, partial [Tirmania nivea]